MEKTIIKNRVIGVDISLNETTIAIVDLRGNIIARDSVITENYPNINGFVEAVCDKVVELAEANGGYELIRSLGVSSPSGNFKTGCIENSPNMPWKGVIPLSAMMRDRLGLAVAVGNDSHVIALGEQTYGRAHGMKNFAVVTIGHGLGNAFSTNGHIHMGADGFAGEVGHTCVVDHGRKCECGLEGCLETYVAEKGIIRTAKEMMAESDKPSLMRDLEKLTPRTIAECCDKGDEMAIEVYRRTGYVLGIGLANLAAVIDPEAIIIAGGISHAGKWLLERATESFNEHLFFNLRGRVKLLLSGLNDRERDVLGASALAWEVEEYSLFK